MSSVSQKIWQHLTPLSRTQIEIESGADVERLPENLAALNPSVTHADRDRIERIVKIEPSAAVECLPEN